MSPQARATLIHEILQHIQAGNIGLAAIFDEEANGQYFINAQGQVAFTGRGAKLIDDKAVSAVDDQTFVTHLENLTDAELIVVLDCLGDVDAGGVVKTDQLINNTDLPAHFEDYCEASPVTIGIICASLSSQY